MIYALLDKEGQFKFESTSYNRLGKAKDSTSLFINSDYSNLYINLAPLREIVFKSNNQYINQINELYDRLCFIALEWNGKDPYLFARDKDRPDEYDLYYRNTPPVLWNKNHEKILHRRRLMKHHPTKEEENKESIE
jgi:hypothetical protein